MAAISCHDLHLPHLLHCENQPDPRVVQQQEEDQVHPGIMEAVLSKLKKYNINLRRLIPGGRWPDVVEQALHFIILLCFTEEDVGLHLLPPGRESNIEGAGL